MQPRRDRGREGRQIGPHVGIGFGADGGEVVVRIQRQFDLGDVVTAMRVGHERLRPGGGPFDRALQCLGREGAEGFLGIVENLGAEAAAHVRGHHAQLVLGDIQDKRAHQQTDDMRVLRRCIKRRLTVMRCIIAHRHARLHRIRDQTVVHQFQRRDMRRVFHRLLDGIAVFLDEAPIIAQVAVQFVMHLGRALGDGLLHVDDSGQLVDLDDDGLHRVTRLTFGLGNDGGNLVADMPNLALGQNRVLRLLHDVAVTAGDLPTTGDAAHTLEILGGENPHHAIHRLGGGSVDRFYRAMRHVRAQENNMRLPGDVDVIGITPLPGQKANVFAPFGAGANSGVLGHNQILPLRRGRSVGGRLALPMFETGARLLPSAPPRIGPRSDRSPSFAFVAPIRLRRARPPDRWLPSPP